MDPKEIKRYLPLVRKPSRYTDGEVNSVRKDLSGVGLTFALAFPDVYEIGMSHLGVQVLYQILNSRSDIACERVFAPWADMEALLREKGSVLSTLESSIPLRELDVLGVSLQYELSYTNFLNMLDLGGVPLLSSDRGLGDPFVIGGGPVAYNPEPVAEFFDAVLIGDGEEAVLEIADAVKEAKARGLGRAEVLERLASIEGVYVPSLFEVSYNEDGTVESVKPTLPGYEVKKRYLTDLESAPLPTRPVVPFTETIHDRLSVEISRGCTRGCRFCQAGNIYRPVRERSPETIERIIEEGIRNTGYDEVGLLSLSTGDYTGIETLLVRLMRRFAESKVAVSLPSLRVGTLDKNLAGEIKRVRKTGFTLAPEAGSERLRNLVNKGITEEALMNTARDVFGLGWKTLKLYFMTGLPTETHEDVEEIVRLAEGVKTEARRAGARRPKVNVSVATFIPKPFTPFQWEGQEGMDEALKKQRFLRDRLRKRGLEFKWHDTGMSLLEGVFSRGDRKLSRVILRAFRMGRRFDGWSDEFSFDTWMEAFVEEGVDPAFYTRRRSLDEVLPWDHIGSGIDKEFLKRELEAALAEAYTPDCKTSRCTNCGVCDFKAIRNMVADAAAPEAGALGERPVERYKLTLDYSKTGDMKYLSHLDFMRLVARCARRADLPLMYSQGYHPMPKISFGQSLPVGTESLSETLVMELGSPAGSGERLTPGEASARLNRASPEGLRFTEPYSLKVPGSSDMISPAEYHLFLKNGPLGLDIDSRSIKGLIRDFKEKDSLKVRVRKGDKTREVDIRSAVEDISLVDGSTLRVRFADRGGPSVRPTDVVEHLFDLTREDASLIPVLKTKPFIDTSN